MIVAKGGRVRKSSPREEELAPPRVRMIRDPWARGAAFAAACGHVSRKGSHNDRQQANGRQEDRSACGVKRASQPLKG
jgi:hypothetical protein